MEVNIKLIITIAHRLDGDFDVMLKKTNITEADHEKLLDLCAWFDMLDIQSQGERYFKEKYELPSELYEFLYSIQFNYSVFKKFPPNEVAIIKY